MPQATNVQDLIDLLHPDIIGGEVESRFDMIRESYQLLSPIVPDYDAFKAVVTDFYQYAFQEWYNATIEMPPAMAWGQAHRILQRLSLPDARLSRIRTYLDNQGGYHLAIKNCLRGRDGGLIKVLDTITEGMKREAVQQYVTSVFLDAIDPLGWDIRIRFMEEYVQRYGHLVLPDEELLSPTELAAHMEAVIESHVGLVNQFRTRLQ